MPSRTESELAEVFRRLGASDPDSWAASEAGENIPQLARFLLLRSVWREIEQWTEDAAAWSDALAEEARVDPSGSFADAGTAVSRMLERGVSVEDVGRLARYVAYSTAFQVLNGIDEAFDPEEDEGLPGWALMEVEPSGEFTGRQVGGLHEDLLGLDPSGREGRPA